MDAPSSSKSEQRRVCVVGSLNMDLVVRAPRFPAAGETILGGEFATFPGGKGANQAVAAARMGAEVSMIGRVGDDAYGVELRRVLDAEGIDTSAVITTKGTPTGVAVITVAEGGGNTIVVAPGANGKVTPADVEAAREKIESADVLLMQLEVPVETVEHTAKLAKALGRHVVLNAAPASRLSPSLLNALDVLIVNETEGALVGADATPSAIGIGGAMPFRAPEGVSSLPRPVDDARTREMLGRLASLGPPNVIATFGEAGSAWIHNTSPSTIGPFAKRCSMIGAFAVKTIDTVGAGDAFCGAIAAMWPSGPTHGRAAELMLQLRATADSPCSEADRVFREDTMARAGRLLSLQLASAAGALATTKPGAIPSLPSLSQAEDLLQSSTNE